VLLLPIFWVILISVTKCLYLAQREKKNHIQIWHFVNSELTLKKNILQISSNIFLFHCWLSTYSVLFYSPLEYCKWLWNFVSYCNMQITPITKILNFVNPDKFPRSTSKYRNVSHIKMSELRTRISPAFQRKLIYLFIY
jgi:hypothetical protein